MSKKAFYLVVLVLVLVAVLFGCNQNANTDNPNENKYDLIAIAGIYKLREEIRNGSLIVYDMQYEFFLSGKMVCRIFGYDASSRETADSVKYGKYVCDQKSGDIAFQFTNADKPYLMHYYGKYIETNVAKFYLTGPNSNGELAGNIVTVSYEVDGPGEVNGGSYQIVDKGGNASMVTATPGPGAKFVEWSDGVTTPTRTDTGLNEDFNVKAKFIQETPLYTVKYIINDEYGEIIGETTQTVLSGGSTKSVIAKCKYPYGNNDNYGYTFVGWSDGVTSEERSDSNVTKDMEITAIIKRVWTVEYYGVDSYLLEKQYVIDGQDSTPVTLEFEYTKHYFVGWEDGVSTLTRQDKNVKSNMKAYANYAPKLKISYAIDENSPYLYGNIEGENYQYIIPGEDASPVTAVPSTWPENMYEFAGWSDGVTTATRQDKNIREEFTVYAKFRLKLPEYIINYIADENGRIDGETSQTVRQGSDGQSVTAVPDEGYEFAGWSDGVTTATRQELNVQANITVTANFAVKEPENTVEFSGGTGNIGNPYKITNIEQLKNVEKYGSSAFILLNDLEFPIAEEGTSNFKPLFSDENPFNGVFEGNDKTISNITMRNEDTFFTGLFAYIGTDGIVKNLKLNNMTVSGTNYIGGVCGYNLGSITNCEVSVNISYIKANDYKVYVGGIAGRSNGCLDNNVSYGTITIEDISAENYVGGLTGCFEGSIVKGANSSLNCIVSGNNNSCIGGLIGSFYGSITTDCYATGSVTATVSGYNVNAGGLIGGFYGSITTDCYATGSVTVSGYDVNAGGLMGSFYGSITDCYATGSVTASGSYVYAGGLIGSFYGGSSITDCYATGSVTASGNSYVYAGGLIGSFSGGSSITDCYATGSVSASGYDWLYAGGLIGMLDGSSITDCYAAGSVSASGYKWVNAGGLIGRLNSDSITDCYATGSVTATATGSEWKDFCVGGLIGEMPRGTVRNSFSLSIVKGNGMKGAIVGRVPKSDLVNVHWLADEESDAVYAVGYDENLGIPTNTGTIKHTAVSDFYTLADTLNEGREEAVWENKDNSSLPTLIKKNKNKGE